MPERATAFLVAREGDKFKEAHALHEGVAFSVGRSPRNNLVLHDDLCSREHAEISFAEDRWYLRDHESLNGTKVNGERVRGDISLSPMDDVVFGHSRFQFVEDLSQLTGYEPETLADTGAPNAGEEITDRLRSTKYHQVPEQLQKQAGGTAMAGLSVLYRLGLDMGGARTLEDLLSVVLDGLMEAIPAEVGAVIAVKDGRAQDVLSYKHRDPKAKTYHKVSNFVTEEVLSKKESVISQSVNTNPKYKSRDSIADLKVTCLICTPVVFEEKILGLVHLYSTGTNSLNTDHLLFAQAVSGLLALAWHQIRRQDALSSMNKELRDSLKLESEMVGESPGLKTILTQVSKVADTNATVLVRGESGSGKELVARAIHFNSQRRDGPLVTLNCAAITESLIESELFGHEKGAFTGATEKMVGKFEAADHGTIFLDEIGEMPLSTQAKFLRVLEGHPFERLGGNNHIRVDVRVVAATNLDLEDAVRAGTFRRDLFFRLQVIEIRIPPLRDRIGDVREIAEHFLRRFAREAGRKIKGLTPAAIQKLEAYHWPGNVRELKNVIERAVALGSGPLLDSGDVWLSSLDLKQTESVLAKYEPISIEELEKRHIQATLEHTQWNKSHAAGILGIERSTLDRKIKGYGLKRDGETHV